MSRPTIPGGAFLPGGVPGGNPLEDYLEGVIAEYGADIFASKGAIEAVTDALAAKADAELTLSSATTVKPIADWISKGIDRPSLEHEEFIYLDHRGSSWLYPENTMEAFRQSYADGSRFFETDCYLLTDGSLGIIHDATVDRTTTGTGDVASLDAGRFKSLVSDMNTAIGAENAFPTLGQLPLVGDLLTEFKGRAVWFLEAKNAGSGAAIVKALQFHDIAKDQVVVEAGPGLYSELDAARAAGFETLYIPGNPGTTDMAALWATSTRWIGCTRGTQTDAVIKSYVDYGFKVIANIPDRRYYLPTYQSMGCRGIYTDDPRYMETVKPLWTSDPFKQKIWAPGHQSFASSYAERYRGRFTADGHLAFPLDDGIVSFVLLGGACPVNPTNHTIYFKVKFKTFVDSAPSKWASVFIAAPSMVDLQYDGGNTATNNGDLILLRKDGRVQIYTEDNGADTLRATQVETATPIGNEEVVSFKITTTPTQRIVQRLDASGAPTHTATYTGGVHRGSYIHIGHSAMPVEFFDIFVT